jgi:hypothetical protein
MEMKILNLAAAAFSILAAGTCPVRAANSHLLAKGITQSSPVLREVIEHCVVAPLANPTNPMNSSDGAGSNIPDIFPAASPTPSPSSELPFPAPTSP